MIAKLTVVSTVEQMRAFDQNISSKYISLGILKKMEFWVRHWKKFPPMAIDLPFPLYISLVILKKYSIDIRQSIETI